MNIIEDSRQQTGKHELKHKAWADHDVKLVRCALPFGDYAAVPAVAVDTKAGMLEIAQNIGGSAKEHDRFRRELQKAREMGCHLYVLIENDEGISDLAGVSSWVNPRLIDSPKAITGERLAKAMQTMQQRYGVTFVFCHPEKAAATVSYLLERGY